LRTPAGILPRGYSNDRERLRKGPKEFGARPDVTCRIDTEKETDMKIATRVLWLLAGMTFFSVAVAQTGSQQSQQPGASGESSKSQSQQPGASGGSSKSQSGQSSSGATRNAPVAGAVPLGLSIEETAVVLKGWRASKLIGAAVYNDQNQRIGKIEDMIVSPDGKISAAVIDVGGFLGIGKHRVAIPADSFTDITAKKLVLPNATKDALKALPEFRFA
jgi:sporulation protein YlmC with PRC-barrel domain